MKARLYISVAGTLIAIVLYFAGNAWAAGGVLLLSLVLELVVSIITGKKGNDTER